jgi:CheY-like chemotaxis protein/anti-sigma regulatory factor (Ser/Thr protein kinase)
VVWTLRDISERARLDRMKSDFVATASHELRSPLTSIKGFVELLGRSQSLGAREQEFVGVILESTDRLVDLVNDLLDASRLEAGKMEVHPRLFDLSELIREVATMMSARLAEKHQRLDLDLPPGLPRCHADPLRVRQILINLVSNAHLYTDEGGRLAVSLDPVPGGLAMSVHDQGRGMSPEEVERVFDRFVRREDGGGGTGLGLSIVKSLVELQGGMVQVRSAPGAGSTFTVTLPVEPQATGSHDARGAIRGKRVLVVDDEPHVAQAIAAQLEPYDVRSEIATTAGAALERLRAGGFDAVTLDLRMNGMGGLDLLREVRRDENLKGMPVVVVSVTTAQPEVAGEWRVGKPADADQLAQALGGAVLAGRTRVLVVGRSAVRPRLEPTLVEMGLDHEWVTSAAAVATACHERRFEVALVDTGIRDLDAVVRELELRGRRLGQTVVLFRTGDEPEGPMRANAIAIEEAAGAVLSALRDS